MQFSFNGNSTLVIDLFDLVDLAALTTSLAPLLQRAIKAANRPERADWRIIFQLIFNGGISEIRVYHRQKSDSKRKEKWVTIHIPIPSIAQVPWGVPPQTIITLKPRPGQEKWYRTLPSTRQAATLQEHCLLAARAGIILALTTGLTVGGHKMQIERSLLEQEEGSGTVHC